MSGSVQAIPASQIVKITPSVLPAGGRALDLIGLELTPSTRPPIGQVLSFPDQPSVAAYFGSTSNEAVVASNYFLGYDNSFAKPGAMLFAQYNQAAVAGWMRGGALGLTLAQLTALSSGTITVTIDGVAHTSASISFSGVTSFSAAAEVITEALGTTGPVGASFTGVIVLTTLTASAVTGTIAAGQELEGAGVDPATVIVAQLTGTPGGAGTYTVSVSQSVSSEPMTTDTPTCTYDPISGAFFFTSATTGTSSSVSFAVDATGTLAESLHLTAATGAVVSPGAAVAVPGPFMDAVVKLTRDWATFTTLFDPDGGSGNTVKQAFAAWVNAQLNEFAYVAWDPDSTPATTVPATTSLGQILEASNSSGTIVLWTPSSPPAPTVGLTSLQAAQYAAFVMSYAASLDFTRTNGRTTLAFRGQTGLAPIVVDGTTAKNVEANFYNYYGEWSTANDDFNFVYPGAISGPWDWADSYYNQIWMSNEFQLAFMLLLTTVGSIPYNQFGYSLIAAAAQDVIDRAGNFGVWRAGVTLSQAQIAEVNAQAGVAIDQTLSTRGWYFQVQDASPEVRQARGSPPCTFWYMDGQSVQRINLASVTVQ